MLGRITPTREGHAMIRIMDSRVTVVNTVTGQFGETGLASRLG
jgi:hypothetical protein